MTEIEHALITQEIAFYKNKIEKDLDTIYLKDLFLKTKSNYNTINLLKKLILDNSGFLEILQNKKVSETKLESEQKDKLEDIYHELTIIIVDNYNEKQDITKNNCSKKSYENIMMFLAMIFKQYDETI